MSKYKLHKDHDSVFVVWKWAWLEDAGASDTNVDSDHDNSGHDNCLNPSSDDPLNPDNDNEVEVIPPIVNHSIVFKCIGSLKEHHYQEILAQVAQKMDNGETVPVKIEKEPNNPCDSHAIAFMCKIGDKWERIGYILREAVETVHEAINNKEILDVHFDWVKYIVFFRDRGWYAGITITRQGEWPRSVCRCSAKTYN